jgi:predicted deacetylase
VRLPPTRAAALAGGPALSVTLHDVAPATQAQCEQLIARLERIGPMPLTLLVTPRYHGRRSTSYFERWLESRLRRGDELALHGLSHDDAGPPPRGWLERVERRWYTDAEGEFAALDEPEAQTRLAAGMRWFARRGWPVRGFVAPAWLLGPAAWAALRRQPFDYTCTLNRLLDLRAQAADPLPALPAWSIVYSTRSAWRRVVGRCWNGALARRQQAAPWMRFELHPGDAVHTPVLDQAMRLVQAARDAQREPLRLGDVVDRLR